MSQQHWEQDNYRKIVILYAIHLIDRTMGMNELDNIFKLYRFLGSENKRIT